MEKNTDTLISTQPQIKILHYIHIKIFGQKNQDLAVLKLQMLFSFSP